MSDEVAADPRTLGEHHADAYCRREGLVRTSDVEVTVRDARTDTATVNGVPVFGEGEAYPPGFPLFGVALFTAEPAAND